MNLFSVAGGNWFFEILNFLLLNICNVIYMFIGWLYRVFEGVANINLFNEKIYDQITGRLYSIIGITMLFILAYNLIITIIDPDSKNGVGSAAKLIQNIIISFALIIVLPVGFNWLHTFQMNIIEEDLIGKIVLGGVSDSCDEDDYNCTCDFSDFDLSSYKRSNIFGWTLTTDEDEEEVITDACESYQNLKDRVKGAYSLAPTIFAAFYYPGNFSFDECVDHLEDGGVLEGEDAQICVNYFYDLNMAKYTGSVRGFVRDSYLNDIVADSEKEGVVEFHGFMAIAAGALALWMFICYTIEIGVRVAKLGLLELMSPIPVMLRILPKNGMFKKWGDQLINTYLDVFIRLALIFFAIFATSLVPDVVDSLFSSAGGDNWFINSLAVVVVILGILKFAQDAPGLIKSFFGGNGLGNFGLKSPAKQIAENKLARGALMGGAGLATGGLLSGIGNARKHINSEMFKNKEMSTKDKWKAVGKGVASGTRGFVDGAYYGAKKGANSDFKNFHGNMEDAVGKAYEARGKREEQRANGKEIFGKDVPPYLQGAVGGMKNIGKSVADVAKNYWELTGTKPTEENYRAMKEMESKILSKSATPSQRIDEITKLESDLKKNLKDNTKEQFVWGSNNKYNRVITDDNRVLFVNDKDKNDVKTEKEMEDIVKSYIGSLKSQAFGEHYSKLSDEGILKNYANTMFESISENMKKLPDQLRDGFYETLNKQMNFENLTKGLGETLKASLGDGLKIESFDDLNKAAIGMQEKLKELSDARNKSTSDEERSKLSLEIKQNEGVLTNLNKVIEKVTTVEEIKKSGMTDKEGNIQIKGLEDLTKVMDTLEKRAVDIKNDKGKDIANGQFEMMYDLSDSLGKELKKQIEGAVSFGRGLSGDKTKLDSKPKSGDSGKK